MHSDDPHIPRRTRLIRPLRWAIPLTLSVLGFGYTFWESVLGDGYSWESPQVVLGIILLVLLGPLLTFVTLNWAERMATSFEQAEAAREQQYRQLLALNQISASVNQSLELSTVLDRALDRILDVMQLRSGEIRLIENGQLVLRACRGVSDDFVNKEHSLPMGECLCGECAARGELVAVEDVAAMPEYATTACACESFRSILSVPVRTTDRVVGVIHVASREPRAYSPSDRALLAAIGNQVGVSIEQAQLHTQLKVLNQQLETRVAERTQDLSSAKEELARQADALRQVLAEERRVEEKTRASIAHDLHDGIQQIIIGAIYETQAARDALQQNPHGAQAHLDAAQELLRRIGVEMRGAIYSLRPLALDVQGLVPALRECVASFERLARITCDLQVQGTPLRSSPEGEIAAFRIVQEALNNVEAHAHAQHATVRICFGARDMQIEITDDGVGFGMDEVMQQTRTHLGLIGMQERAESAGGNLQVWSQQGQGTRISLQLPLAGSRDGSGNARVRSVE